MELLSYYLFASFILRDKWDYQLFTTVAANIMRRK